MYILKYLLVKRGMLFMYLLPYTGVGVYISRVEEGSVAERAGLRPGDSILQVNGTPFSGISHEDALKVSTNKRSTVMPNSCFLIPCFFKYKRHSMLILNHNTCNFMQIRVFYNLAIRH